LGIDWATGADVTLKEAVLRLATAILLSAIIGIDREVRHKPLGLRTNMLVSLGAASFSLMALHLVEMLGHGPTEVQIDPARVMEAIVGAIGFLGAAAIIQGRFDIYGATTGASIWVVGAIGMACGFGFYALAVAITLIGALILTVLGLLTARLGSNHHPETPKGGVMSRPITWVLVADGSRARLFVRQPSDGSLSPALDQELIGTNLPSREIASDRPGRTFDRGGQGRHAKEPPTDPARHANAEFAREVALLLDDRRKAHAFDRLVVVAAPRFLGELRSFMPQQLQDLVAAEIDKDLTKSPPHELKDHLTELLQP
jgi:putative Mg2+ transporter-C (MgtC) family protein